MPKTTSKCTPAKFIKATTALCTFLSNIWAKMYYPNYIILDNLIKRGQALCRTRWGSSQESTLFASATIFISGLILFLALNIRPYCAFLRFSEKCTYSIKPFYLCHPTCQVNSNYSRIPFFPSSFFLFFHKVHQGAWGNEFILLGSPGTEPVHMVLSNMKKCWWWLSIYSQLLIP